jgi:DNA-binding CsgD family transcriptional regulator
MADRSAENIARVINNFYVAASGAMPWHEALAALAGVFDGSRAWLFHARDGELRGHTSVDEGRECLSAEAQLAILSDPLFKLVHQQNSGDFVRHSDLEDMREFRQRDLFREWLLPRDVWFGLVGYLKADVAGHFFVKIGHGRRQGDFSDADMRLLALISPHLLRAGEVSDFLKQSATANETTPELIVDPELRVIRINQEAATLLDRFNSIITVRGGVLRIAAAWCRERLRQLIIDAVAVMNGLCGGVLLLDHPMAAFSATRDEGRLIASVAPLAGSDHFRLGYQKRAVVRLRLLDESRDQSLDALLISLFDLQPSHARLARSLIGGQDLRNAATQLGLSYSSARTYLDHVFRKTGTSRQSELVALMKSLQAASRL